MCVSLKKRSSGRKHLSPSTKQITSRHSIAFLRSPHQGEFHYQNVSFFQALDCSILDSRRRPR